jgi:hypothetical protein
MFAICGLQIWNGKVHCFYAQEFSKPHEDVMVHKILALWETSNHQAKIYVDGANVSFIRKLKSKLTNEQDMDWQLDYLRKQGRSDEELPQYMTCVPVSFNRHGPRMLQTAATYLQRKYVAIHPSFEKLVEQLQIARVKDSTTHDWQLDKSSHSMDLLDAYRLAHYDFLISG